MKAASNTVQQQALRLPPSLPLPASDPPSLPASHLQGGVGPQQTLAPHCRHQLPSRHSRHKLCQVLTDKPRPVSHQQLISSICGREHRATAATAAAAGGGCSGRCAIAAAAAGGWLQGLAVWACGSHNIWDVDDVPRWHLSVSRAPTAPRQGNLLEHTAASAQKDTLLLHFHATTYTCQAPDKASLHAPTTRPPARPAIHPP